MFTNNFIHDIVKTTLVADTHALGAHWVYDEAQLKALPIDWEALNAPQAMWHKGKRAGDFTHIGDQLYWGYLYFKEQTAFDASKWLSHWHEKMQAYSGYIDGATRATLENIQKGDVEGSTSHDFSVIGRIAPLLFVSEDEDKFVQNVKTFVSLTHNNSLVIEAAAFFAKVLCRYKKASLPEIVEILLPGLSDELRTLIQKGIASKDEDTFNVVRRFGPACDVEEGVPCIMHLLYTYYDLQAMLLANAKAGGDNASRAMVVSMIMKAFGSRVNLPSTWYKTNVALDF